MRPPCETVGRSFIASLRAEVAKELVTHHGWTQERVAECIGVTQPSVSHYLKPATTGQRKDNRELRVLAMNIAEGLTSGQLTIVKAVEAMCRLCAKSRVGGVLCALHKDRFKELESENCGACRALFSSDDQLLRERLEVLSELRKAVSVLEQSEAFPEVMPEVNVNIVMALREASTVADVAGIPGRIVKVKGRARAFMEPEFGVSSHMARVLLAAMKRDPETRSAMNLRFDERVEEAMRALGPTYYRIDRSIVSSDLSSDERIVVAVEEAIRRISDVPYALVDPGEHGIESVAYVYGYTAVKVAQQVERIARRVVGRELVPT